MPIDREERLLPQIFRGCQTLLTSGFVIALALLTLHPAAQAAGGGLRADAPEYGRRGAHVVGYRSIRIDQGWRSMDAGVWYPAATGSLAPETIQYPVTLKMPVPGWHGETVINGRASRDAPVDINGGPWPVVIFSHGFPLNGPWYADLIEHLASHGFVVIAPEHVERLRDGDESWLDLVPAAVDRPKDVASLLDFIERAAAGDPVFRGAIDPSRIAIAGHSYGGYTALAAGGARLDWKGFGELCAALPENDARQFLCPIFSAHQADMARQAGLEAVPEGLWPASADPRIDAVISIAGDAYPFGPHGLAGLRKPLLVIGGTADSGTPWEWGGEMTWRHAGSPRKMMVAFNEAEHMMVSRWEMLPWAPHTPLYRFFPLEPVWDKARVIDLVNHFITAFLRSELNRDADAAGALGVSRTQFRGVVVESEGLVPGQ